MRQDFFIIDPENPIRAELFSVERLEQHARSLAEAQGIAKRARKRRPLPKRLRENAKILVDSFREIARSAQAHCPITPAGEWLLDNFHVVEEQIREIKNGLPADYYGQLPKLEDGPLAGYPRVYGIAWALVAHTDSAFDLEKLTRFLDAYQQVTPLTIGELWAIAVTLRLTLIENLRRLAQSIVRRSRQTEEADHIADRVLAAQTDATLKLIIEDLSERSLSAATISRLEQKLRDRDGVAAKFLHWMGEKIAGQGMSVEQIVREEYQTQGAVNVTVRNIITSMRLLSDIDWTVFVESISLVDRVLSADSDFEAMEFATRDQYRSVIERLSRGSERSELEIARDVAARASTAKKTNRPSREQDPGYYLIARGRRDLERALGYRPALRDAVRRAISRAGLGFYLPALAAMTALFVALAWWAISGVVSHGALPLATVVILAVLPASDLAMALINRMVTQRLGPDCLPGMALRDGIPDPLRTLLVVPALLSDEQTVERDVRTLEVHYLSNTDRNLIFALLTDWEDSDTEIAAQDQSLLEAAQKGIEELNTHYGEQRFFLLHRRRCWNPAQGKWMGWERKRGKLHELNRLLRGATDTSFIVTSETLTQLGHSIRYVITLDADTRLPRGSAIRLVGKMAHPLNRPVIDQDLCRVVEGHAILQPRVTPSLPPSRQSSLFQWAFSGPNGLDPYAFAVSDVYQDLFEEGSYVGKGIYDIDAFEHVLQQRIPENTVLSHDLLEGTFARAALASDVEVVEEFPSRYDVEARRQHRWMRGDWQLLPWIFARGYDLVGDKKRSSIPLLARWKMLDNLRRSLSAPALLLALLWGWTLPSPADVNWTLFILAAIVVPPLLPLVTAIVPHRVGISRRTHIRNLVRDFTLALTQILFVFTFLARAAWLSLDAIVRTVFRLFVSRRYMLEWISFARSNYDRRSNLKGLMLQLSGSVAFAGGAAAIILATEPSNAPFASAFLALWALSPVIARWASAPRDVEAHRGVAADERKQLRLIARRTWRFFETFVTAEENYLPPDNFQEDPKPVVAHRTSPTNIGLYIVTVLAARDFGWIGTAEALDRIEATLVTMEKLERYRGHFLNWYETQTLQSLEPRYVSSVDSGNLASNLIVLRNAMLEIAEAPPWDGERFEGVADALALLRQACEDAPQPKPPQVETILTKVEALEQSLRQHPADSSNFAYWLESAAPHVTEIEKIAARSGGEIAAWAKALSTTVQSHARDAEPIPDFQRRVRDIAEKAQVAVSAMDFRFLLEQDRQLLSIGFRVDDQALDGSAYDLLASEARLASFLAIAKGDIPTRNWFRLGRTMIPLRHGSVLLSWSGSMFEYLMPTMLMREPAGSLLAQSNRLAVWRQIDYGHELGIPWGISESQYNARDREQNYQYTGFGVPDLGLKRGLSENTVVAPYATGLAAMVAPVAALKNYARLTRIGARGVYGWYEAVDYTPARIPEGSSYVVVRSYMAHHQAMTIVGIADVVNDGRIRERFHAEPMVQATELLLQERMPRDVSVARPPPELKTGAVVLFQSAPPTQRRYTSPYTPKPRTHLLSNGHYAVMMTAAGSGYSRWGDLAITRWREDAVRDQWGSYIYLRDARSGATWSAGFQPSATEPDTYEAIFSEDRCTIHRNDLALMTTLDVAVSPEDDAEVRRVTITNHGSRTREIDVTSYAELVLARPADDLAHPAFSKMFIETEFDPELGVLLATRRPRSPGDPAIWVAHLSVVEGMTIGEVQYETDRARFLGRNRTARMPAGVFDGWPLSNTVGAVLDPVFSLRRRVSIPRGQTVTVAFWTIAGATREDVIDLADKHRDAAAFTRAATLAATQAQAHLQYLGITPDEANLFQQLANCVLYPETMLRTPQDILRRAGPASTLWPLGISGDHPIVVLRIDEPEDIEIARQLLRAHSYWRSKLLTVDLVVLNDRAASYAQDLQTALDTLVRAHVERLGGQPGTVYLLRNDLLNTGVREQLLAAARVVLSNRRGTLAQQIEHAFDDKPLQPPRPRNITVVARPEAMELPKLEYANGFGGFAADGREYAVVMENGQLPPAPWINVIANPDFGFQVSNSGSGFSWCSNSQQNQITGWSNDPVTNESSEILYLRDLDTGDVWSPTAYPIRDPQFRYTAHHGHGYSRFEHASRGIGIELTQFVPLNDPVKISRLKLINRSNRPRKLSLTAYVEWTLGPNRQKSQAYIYTEIDKDTSALFAQNPWSEDFHTRIAFFDLQGKQTSWTADRCEFLGRNGSPEKPWALMGDAPLSMRTGAGLDSCGALQTEIRLAPGAEAEIIVTLGQSESRSEARALISRIRSSDFDNLLKDVKEFWDTTLGSIEVKTPDRAMDLLLNRWLLYQTLSCRMWARAGFYQASGAYGFRDQLQDCMALCVSHPEVARRHILRAAARQFPEGDVQHWWLPETGKGVRTTISDDRAWLAYVVSHYIEVTGDNALLDEQIPFLDGQLLKPGEHEAFFQPQPTSETATLYEHCARALDLCLPVGPHGLPLMGTGDWNDGMNRVGENGKGESVWLGWFVYDVLTKFIPIAEARNDGKRAATWLLHTTVLKEALEDNGWDGDWYRRAYYDDGTPLGSVANAECRIDSIAQSWSVLSKAADSARTARAMQAVDKYLVRDADQMILLFTPPFVDTQHDPGYIKGYPAGLRENGGQYTHGVMWVVAAFAEMGMGNRAGELFAMLNPINHSRSRTAAQRYRVEPYVACGDVYSVPPHVGRGGWTWYSGSAGWMYRVGIEWILGLRVKAGKLALDPCIPSYWPRFEATLRYKGATFKIAVENPHGVCKGIAELYLDGMLIEGATIVLPQDGSIHTIRAVMGEPPKIEQELQANAAQ
ncbi:MAG TPA: glucoamylase family protein [Rhizomicrobium sp.]|nr:glucoamylase family protein [Rhizomicrobium sp.]